jgi:hypothetical protein
LAIFCAQAGAAAGAVMVSAMVVILSSVSAKGTQSQPENLE